MASTSFCSPLPVIRAGRSPAAATWSPATQHARSADLSSSGRRPARPVLSSAAHLATSFSARAFFVGRPVSSGLARPWPQLLGTQRLQLSPLPIRILCTQMPPADTVYEGRFGSFTVTDDDRREVLIYRSSLVGVAVACCAAAAMVDAGSPTAEALLAALAAAQACLGVSLWTIHIYMKPLHKALQACWAVGVGSTLAVAAALGPAALYENTLTELGTGWFFVSLTGLLFKEAFCFGRLEAVAGTILVPVLSAGHFLHLLGPGAEKALLTALAPGLVIFAARKFAQRPEDDIGDKSVFEHLEAGGKIGEQ